MTSALNPSVPGSTLLVNAMLAQQPLGSNRPASPFNTSLSELADPCGGRPGVWADGSGTHLDADGEVSDGIGGRRHAAASIDRSAASMGIDSGWACLDGGWSVDVGLSGSLATGNTEENFRNADGYGSTTAGDFEQRSIGGYLTVAKDRYFLDFDLRYGRTDLDLTNRAASLHDAGLVTDVFAASTAVGANYEFGDGYVFIPSLGLAYAHVDPGQLAYGTIGSLQLDRYDSWRGFIRGAVSRDIELPGQGTVTPYLEATLYEELGDEPTALFRLQTEERQLALDTAGTAGELSAGLRFSRKLDGADGKSPRTIGGGLRGDLVFGDHLEGARALMEFRLQW